MTFKSLLSSPTLRDSRRDDATSAGGIVFLMMALVFVPILVAHVVVILHDQLPSVGAQQLAAIVNAILPTF